MLTIMLFNGKLTKFSVQYITTLETRRPGLAPTKRTWESMKRSQWVGPLLADGMEAAAATDGVEL